MVVFLEPVASGPRSATGRDVTQESKLGAIDFPEVCPTPSRSEAREFWRKARQGNAAELPPRRTGKRKCLMPKQTGRKERKREGREGKFFRARFADDRKGSKLPLV